jgi:hypothetical protein
MTCLRRPGAKGSTAAQERGAPVDWERFLPRAAKPAAVIRSSSLALVLAAVLLGPQLARAQVDARAAMPVLLKVLTYDVNFDARGVGPFVVLLVAGPGQAAAKDRLIAELEGLAAQKIKARPVKYVATELLSEAQLQAEIEKHHASALLAVPGLPLPLVKVAWEVAQDNQLYALALEATTAEQVFPVGVTLVQDKPQIIINEKAARAVGARFEASVLRLARVIQEPK